MKKLLFLFFILFFGELNAQNLDKDTFNLNEVGITSVRFNLENVSSEILRPDSSENFSQETPFYFSKTTSVFSQSDNGTPFGYSYFTLRGMGQTRINYTLNGVPLNDGEDLAVYTSNYTNLIDNLRSIQIIRGAGISSNGASSYAGLINMDMKSPFDSKEIELKTMYGSFGSYRQSINYNSGLIKNKFGVYANISNTGSNGFRDFSSGRSTCGYLSIGYSSSKYSIRFNSIYGITKNGQAWLPVPENQNPKYNPLVFGNLKPQYDNFKQAINQIQFFYSVNQKTVFTLSPYLISLNGGYDFPLDENTTGNLNLNANNFGVYSNVKKYYNNITAEIGANYNDFSRKHNSTIYGDQYTNTGYKLDYSFYSKVSYLKNKFIANGDVQYRKAKFDYQGSEISKTFFDYNFLNYFVGFSYKSKFSPYVSLSKTTREPTRTDIFGYNDNIDLSNIDQINVVKPESVNDIEFGIKHTSNKIFLNINFYYMNFDNEILSTNQLNYLGILLRKNVDKSQRKGFELEGGYKVNKKLEVGGNLNISNNKVLIDNSYKKPILTPELIAFIYTKAKIKKIEFELNYKYVSKSYLESSNNSNFKCEELHMINSSVTYNMKSKLFVSLFANNLLNKNWQTSGNVTYDLNGIPASRNYFYSCGINYYLQLKFVF